MRKSITSIVLCLALSLGLSSVVGAGDWYKIASEAAAQHKSMPGVWINAMIIAPETQWCLDRDRLSSDDATTSRFAETWPAERKKGLTVEVYISTNTEDLAVEWQEARIWINGGLPVSPKSFDLPPVIKAGTKYGSLGYLTFPYDWSSPLSEVRVELPSVLPGIDPPDFTWAMPLPFPETVTSQVASVVGGPIARSAAPETAKLSKDTSLMTGPDGASLGDLLFGTDVLILEEQGDWAKVTVTGWVPKDNLMNREYEDSEPEDTFTVVYMNKQPSPSSATGNGSVKGGVAGDGFLYRNVVFKRDGRFTQAFGEIENTSSNSYSFATFTLTVYSPSGSIVGVGNIMVQNIRGESTKTFQTLLDAELPASYTFKLQFENAF